MALTLATWRRESKLRFEVFLDFSFQWDSRGRWELDDDASMRLVGICNAYHEWDTATVLQPRGTRKTTIITLWACWINWRHPWIHTGFISATPKVSDDAFGLALHHCKFNPLLTLLRPKGVVKVNEREFDTPYRVGKGRSFRFLALRQGITGLRCHNFIKDDMETKETVRSQRMRETMNLVRAETVNVLHKGHWFHKSIESGTPWDSDSSIRNQDADVHVETPAIIINPDSTLTYPFKALQEAELARIRFQLHKLGQEHLFRSQFLLDTSRDNESFPIRMEEIRFASFDPHSLYWRRLIVDPAGGKKTTSQLGQIRTGDRRGDGMTLCACGIHGPNLRIIDLWSEYTNPEELLKKAVWMIKTYRIQICHVEGNQSGWMTAFQSHFTVNRVNCQLEEYWSSKNKLEEILATLVPMFGLKQIDFHERLAHYKYLVDPLFSQLLNLRWHSLPGYDDVLDVLKWAVKLNLPFLYGKPEPLPGTMPDESTLVAAHARPETIELARRRNRGPIVPVTLYDAFKIGSGR